MSLGVRAINRSAPSIRYVCSCSVCLSFYSSLPGMPLPFTISDALNSAARSHSVASALLPFSSTLLSHLQCSQPLAWMGCPCLPCRLVSSLTESCLSPAWDANDFHSIPTAGALTSQAGAVSPSRRCRTTSRATNQLASGAAEPHQRPPQCRNQTVCTVVLTVPLLTPPAPQPLHPPGSAMCSFPCPQARDCRYSAGASYLPLLSHGAAFALSTDFPHASHAPAHRSGRPRAGPADMFGGSLMPGFPGMGAMPMQGSSGSFYSYSSSSMSSGGPGGVTYSSTTTHRRGPGGVSRQHLSCPTLRAPFGITDPLPPVLVVLPNPPSFLIQVWKDPCHTELDALRVLVIMTPACLCCVQVTERTHQVYDGRTGQETLQLERGMGDRVRKFPAHTESRRVFRFSRHPLLLKILDSS